VQSLNACGVSVRRGEEDRLIERIMIEEGLKVELQEISGPELESWLRGMSGGLSKEVIWEVLDMNWLESREFRYELRDGESALEGEEYEGENGENDEAGKLYEDRARLGEALQRYGWLVSLEFVELLTGPRVLPSAVECAGEGDLWGGTRYINGGETHYRK